MKFFVAVSFFLALACIRARDYQSKENIRLMINHYRVPCVGAGTQLCYLTREVSQPSWDYLFEGIDGFNYEWGKVYELEVEKTHRKDVKADQSPVSYKLIRIVSSKDAPANEPFSLIIKDVEMVAVRKADNGEFSLLGQYPLICKSASLCDELESKLEAEANLTGMFRHSADHRSLVLQSLKN